MGREHEFGGEKFAPAGIPLIAPGPQRDLEGLIVKRKDGKYTIADALAQNLKSRLHAESRPAGIFSETVNSRLLTEQLSLI